MFLLTPRSRWQRQNFPSVSPAGTDEGSLRVILRRFVPGVKAESWWPQEPGRLRPWWWSSGPARGNLEASIERGSAVKPDPSSDRGVSYGGWLTKALGCRWVSASHTQCF